ncbi:MAG: hypothetical protein ACRDS1_18105, partial [Pseudonocardiaceae bacterium]
LVVMAAVLIPIMLADDAPTESDRDPSTPSTQSGPELPGQQPADNGANLDGDNMRQPDEGW